MGNPPFEDAFPIGKGGFPLPYAMLVYGRERWTFFEKKCLYWDEVSFRWFFHSEWNWLFLLGGLVCFNKWVFPKIGVPQNGWFVMENPIKMDDLGVFPYFWKHPNLPSWPDFCWSVFGDKKSQFINHVTQLGLHSSGWGPELSLQVASGKRSHSWLEYPPCLRKEIHRLNPGPFSSQLC